MVECNCVHSLEHMKEHVSSVYEIIFASDQILKALMSFSHHAHPALHKVISGNMKTKVKLQGGLYI